MTFTDEESRLEFHASHTMLQLMAQMLESFAFEYSQETEFIKLMDKQTAVLGVTSVTQEEQEELCAKVNGVFRRKDERTTCSIFPRGFEYECLGLFVLLSTGPDDLVAN